MLQFRAVILRFSRTYRVWTETATFFDRFLLFLWLYYVIYIDGHGYATHEKAHRVQWRYLRYLLGLYKSARYSRVFDSRVVFNFTVEKENRDPDNHAMLLETENKWKENDRNWRKLERVPQIFLLFLIYNWLYFEKCRIIYDFKIYDANMKILSLFYIWDFLNSRGLIPKTDLKVLEK